MTGQPETAYTFLNLTIKMLPCPPPPPPPPFYYFYYTLTTVHLLGVPVWGESTGPIVERSDDHHVTFMISSQNGGRL